MSNPDAGTIRLMALLPGAFEDGIRLELCTTKLFTEANERPVYEALSYTWGSEENPLDIDIVGTWERRYSMEEGGYSIISSNLPGGRLAVTQNLSIALRYLRLEDRPRKLWIDAICVDQKNPKERGYQVGRMADIYRYADKVVAWIGSASEDSSLAIQKIQSVGSQIEVDWMRGTMKPSSHGESHWADLDLALPFDDEIWRAFSHLLHRPWFKRLWIWQEVLLANTVDIQCGYETLDWSSFRKAICCLHMKPAREIIDTAYYSIMTHVYRLIANRPGIDINRPLQWVLYETQDCEFTDPRDRMYALLNVSKKSPSLMGLTPDYTQDPRDVYQDVVLRHLAHEGLLNFLSDCEWSEDFTRKPTWVPDWSKPRISISTLGSSFNRGSIAKAELVEDGVLKVTGLNCAEISNVEMTRLHDEGLATFQVADVIRLIQILAEHIDLNASYVDGSHITAAFCRTLCMNKVSDQFFPTTTDIPDFERSLEYLQSLLQDSLRQVEPYGTFLKWVLWAMKGRRFFTTKEGYIGLAPEAVTTEDQVCIVLGCQSPLLLRRSENERYVLIGECYIHGLMNGEAFLGSLSSEWQCAYIAVGDVGAIAVPNSSI